MPTRIAKLTQRIVDQLETADLTNPHDVRKKLADEPPELVQLLAEMAARGMLKPASQWPGRTK